MIPRPAPAGTRRHQITHKPAKTRAFFRFELALAGTDEHAKAAFFNGIFDGIVISDTMIATKYHAMFFWQLMV